jgi:hypothetical protein
VVRANIDASAIVHAYDQARIRTAALFALLERIDHIAGRSGLPDGIGDHAWLPERRPISEADRLQLLPPWDAAIARLAEDADAELPVIE